MAPGQVARRVSELQRIASDANARLIFERGGMLDAGAGGQALLTKLIGTNFGIGSGAHKAALARRESIRSSLGAHS